MYGTLLRSWTPLVALLGALLASPAPARAAPDGGAPASARPADPRPPAPLEVRRGPGASACPDAPALWRRALAQGASAPAGEGFVVELDGGPDGSLRATLRQGDAEPRRLRDLGPGCEALAEAVALALALASPAGSPPAPAPDRTGETWQAHLALGPGLGLGLTARPGALLAAGAAVAGERHALGLDLLLTPPQSFDAGPGEVSVVVAGATVRGCRRLAGGRGGVELDGCLGPSLRWFRGAGSGLVDNRQAGRLSPAALVAVQASGPLVGPVGWSARLEGFAPLRRESLSVDGVGVVHRTPAVGGAAVVQLRWTLR